MKNTIILKFALLSSLIFLFTSCINCPKNYTSDIHFIMEPMKIQLKNFFENEQIYPNYIQRDRLLENSGCKIIDIEKRKCRYKNITFTYDSNEGILYPEPINETNELTTQPNDIIDVTPIEPEREEGINIYTFAIVKENSLCTLNMTYQGKMLDIECIQHSCISK